MWPVPVHARMRYLVFRVLFRYGQLVGRCPWPFIVVPVLVLGGLGAGLLKMERTEFSDDVSMPRDIESFQDQKKMQRMFQDRTGDHYDALELSEDQIMGSIIFIAKDNGSVYDDDILAEIHDVIADVKANVTAVVNNVTLKYEDLCGRRHNECVVTGERLLAPEFNAMRNMSILTYPKWKLPTTGDMVDLSFALADADKKLKRVGVVRVTFKLRHDRQPEVFLWEDAFVKFMQTLQTNKTDIVFSASSSISRELEADFDADVFFVWLSLGLIALCSWLVTWGGDMVSTRAFLVPMGLVSPVLGMVGAMGLLSLCAVRVVELVWVTPMLVLGVGLVDMFLLMTSWSSRLDKTQDTASQRVGWVVADTGPAITTASLSLFVAFTAAYISSFPSVANMGLYAGVAVLFSYLSTMTFGVGCLAVHARRVTSSRHVITCQVTFPCDKLRTEGRSLCTSSLCGGSIPTDSYGDQGVIEKIPRLLLQKVTSGFARIVVVVVYLVLLAVAIVGVVHIKQGVDLITLVKPQSYTHDYLVTDAKYFGFSFPVVFVLDEGVDYNQQTVNRMIRLIVKAKKDPAIEDEFDRCWLVDFKKSPFYNQTAEGATFPLEAVEEFVNSSEVFMNDIVLDERGQYIDVSRCYVFTEKNSDQEELTNLMQRMRGLADKAGFQVFAYHPAFLNYDQRLSVLPSLFQTLLIALLVLCIVHLVLFPEFVITMLVLTSAVSIIWGMVGLMSFLNISLSFVSIAHIVLNAGFAMCFSVHTGAAYLQSECSRRSDRVADAVSRAAAPVFVVGVCLMIGASLYATAVSYSFAVLCQMTLLTLLIALFHSVFLVPTVLSWIGCEKSPEEVEKDQALKEAVNPHLISSIHTGTNGHIPGTEAGHSNMRGKVHSVGKDHAFSNGKSWSSYYTAPSTVDAPRIHVIGKGSVGHGHYKEHLGLNTEPIADYESTGVGECPHGLTSHSYEHAGKSLSSHGYYKLPRLSTVSNHYDNWPVWTNGSKDVYDDIPVSLPSSRDDRKRNRTPNVINTDFSGPGRLGSEGNKTVSPPPSAKRSMESEMLEPDIRIRSRSHGDAHMDIVASLVKMDDAFLGQSQSDPAVASLEGVHHVACTLSTNGVLGASQAYVTENFRDIPC